MNCAIQTDRDRKWDTGRGRKGQQGVQRQLPLAKRAVKHVQKNSHAFGVPGASEGGKRSALGCLRNCLRNGHKLGGRTTWEPLFRMEKWSEEGGLFPVIWEQLRNSGQESCTLPSPGLLRLYQLQSVEHLTLDSMWALASLTEAFSSPGGAAEQHKGRGTALQSAEAAVGPPPP